MKKHFLFILLISAKAFVQGQAPDTWTDKNGLGMGIPAGSTMPARYGAVSFSINGKGYIGTGYNNVPKNDFWEFDPATNSLTQKANFGGSSRSQACGFSIGTKGYIGTGVGGGYENDFWEYNPLLNTWTQKNNFGGSARGNAVGFSLGNKGYIGTGLGLSTYKDFWEFDPVTGNWTQKTNFPEARYAACAFAINSYGYVGTGNDSLGNAKKDFWEYDPSSNGWIQKGNFGGSVRNGAVGFCIGTKGYLGTGYNNGSYLNDFWEYEPVGDFWLQQQNIPGNGRTNAIGFNIGVKGFIGTGSPGVHSDLWEFFPQNNTWTLRFDLYSNARNSATGFSIGNKGYIGTGQLNGIYLDDFWEYDVISGFWTQKANVGGGVRGNAVSFSIGNRGYVGTGNFSSGSKKDFWEYNPATNTWAQKTDFGGTARYLAAGFSIGDKGYIGTGYTNTYTKDFWQYDSKTNTWSQKADFAGTARYAAFAFNIANKGYLGTGSDQNNKNDFWQYNPDLNLWIQKADLTLTGRRWAIGFSIADKGYAGTGSVNNNAVTDFWEYSPALNSWTQRANYIGQTLLAVGFNIGGKGYIGTGINGNGISFNDFREYNPVCSTAQDSIYPSGNSSICSGDSAFLYSVIGYNYQWHKNGVAISGATANYYYAKNSGIYTCSLINSCNNILTNGITVTVNALPSANITPSGPTSFCSGGNVTLNAPVAANRSYQWRKSGTAIAGAVSSSYTATSSGTYKVIVTNTITGCSKLSGTGIVVTVYANPTAMVTPQGLTTFCNGDSVQLKANYNSTYLYQWKKNNTNISGATSNKYEAKTAGSYKVKATNSNGCTKLSNTISVSVPCRENDSTGEEFTKMQVDIYPNPTSGVFIVDFHKIVEKGFFIIYDLLGNIVLKENINSKKQIEVDLKNSPPGIYTVFVFDGKKSWNRKLMIHHH